MNDDIDPELKSTLKWAKKTSEVKPTTGLETRILARLEAEQRHRSRRPWLWGLSGGLATAVVAGLVIISTRDMPNKETLYAPTEIDLVVPVPKADLKNIPASPPAQWKAAQDIADAKEKSMRLKSVAKLAAPQPDTLADRLATRGNSDKESGAGLRRQGVASYQNEARYAATPPDDSPRVIRTQAEWKNFWDSPPAVDFSKRMVIAVFDGKIVSHKIRNGKLVVQYRTMEVSVRKSPTDWLAVPVFNGPVEFLLANERK